MFLYKLFETWKPHKFEEHFEGIRKFYRKQRDIMLAAVEKHLTGTSENYFDIFYAINVFSLCRIAIAKLLDFLLIVLVDLKISSPLFATPFQFLLIYPIILSNPYNQTSD